MRGVWAYFTYYWLVIKTATGRTSWFFGGWRFFALPTLAFFFGAAIHAIGLRAFPWLEELAGRPDNEMAIYVIYGIAGVVAFLAVVWLGAAIYAPVMIHTGQANQILALTSSDDLPVKLKAAVVTGSKTSIRLSGATLTNQSTQNVALQFTMMLDFRDNGFTVRRWATGKWENESKPTSSDSLVTLSPQTTLKGVLLFTLPDKMRSTDFEFPEDAILRILDTVSGIVVECDPMKGYPPKRAYPGVVAQAMRQEAMSQT